MATASIPPIQTEPLWVVGAPEGRDYAPPGFLEIDKDTGIWWKKTTRQELNTGWEQFGTSSTVGGHMVLIGETDPSGVAPHGCLYTKRPTGAQWFYDAVLGEWVKNIGP